MSIRLKIIVIQGRSTQSFSDNRRCVAAIPLHSPSRTLKSGRSALTAAIRNDCPRSEWRTEYARIDLPGPTGRRPRQLKADRQ
jgi:hypothetical protein